MGSSEDDELIEMIELDVWQGNDWINVFTEDRTQ